MKTTVYRLLKWSEKWSKTDMLYLAKGFSWLSISKVVGSLTALGLAIAYANILPKDAYALYKYVLSIFGILGVFSLSGINSSITRSTVLGFEGSLMQGIRAKLKWSSLAVISGLVISAYYFYNQNTTLGVIFLVASVFSPITESIVYGPFLEGKKLFKTASILSSANQLLLAISIICALLIWPNAIALVTTYFLAQFFAQLLFFVYIFRKYKLNNKKDEKLVSFGKHMSMMNVLSVVSENIDKILLWHFIGPVQLAIYSFAIVPINQSLSFLKSFSMLAYPKIASQNIDILKKTLPKKIFKFSFLLIFPIVLYIILAPFLFKIIFPQYVGSVIYSQIFAISLFFFPYRMFSHPLIALAEKKSLYILQTISPIIRIALLAILLPTFGIMGAIIAIILATFANSMLTFYFFMKLK